MTDFKHADEACREAAAMAEEFVVLTNPEYVFPPREFCPLARKITGPVDGLDAVVCDMEGTTTTTENLCLNALETMVRRITGWSNPQAWPGLDKQADYPHIIGNSTTRDVEYLVQKYGASIDRQSFVRAVLDAWAWTLAEGRDEGRQRQITRNLRALGWNAVLDDNAMWQSILRGTARNRKQALDTLATKYAQTFPIPDFSAQVRLAIDVYYHRYHEILVKLDTSALGELGRELATGKRFIEPMPGVGVFLALVKGWLGADAGKLYDQLAERAFACAALPAKAQGTAILSALGARFAARPVKLAVVTSSIRYEARIVLDQVLAVIREQAAEWPGLGHMAERFASIDKVCNVFVTASDSHELRLKPHRDLYSIALRALGLGLEAFGRVAAFEDSESGTIAIRAAGMGLCVAVPFCDTADHDFRAASHVLKGGLPEAVLNYNLFLKA